MQDKGSFTDYKTGVALSADTVTKLINRQFGATQTGIQLQVTDTQLNPVAVNNSNNSDPSDVTDLVDMGQTCAVSHDVTRPVHRTFSFTMRDPQDINGKVKSLRADGLPLFPINPYQNFLRLWYLMSAGGYNLKVSLGYYVPAWPKRYVSPGSMSYKFACTDLTALIAKTDFISDWVTSSGTSGGYIGAVSQILQSDGTPKSLGGKGVTPAGQDDAGPAIPANLLNFNSAGNIAVPVPYLYKAQTNRVDAVNQLFDGQNFYPIWNGLADGSFRSSQKPYYGNGIPAIGFDYTPTPETSITEVPFEQDFSLQADARICNVVRVTSSSTKAGSGAFSTVLQNTNPNSVVSSVNLRTLSGGPRSLVRYENNSKLLTAAMVQLRAQILLQEGAMLAEQVTATTLPNPLHEDHDIIVCNVDLKDGLNVIPSSQNSPFEEQKWSIDLRPSGRMRHLWQRIIPV